ncbi:MAG: hypothetical protein IJX25_04875 [Clostridia bacterium]|nr:hypothetical protein [Clostridia bacterium]
MKKFIFIFTLIFSLSFFCGCKGESFVMPSDSIFTGINFFSNGEISQVVAISVDSDYIDSVAKSGESVQFKSNLLSQMENLRQKFLLTYAIVYIQNPIEELQIGRGVKLTPVSYKEENDFVYFEIIFSSTLAWQYYHNALTEGADINESMPFLMEKKSNTTLFPFSSLDANGTPAGESYKNIYLSSSEGLSFEDKVKENYSPCYIYQYGTYSNKIKSDGNYKFLSDGINYHIWVADEDELQGKSTTIYYYKINKGGWLLLALIIPTAGLVIYLICIKIKIKKEKGK